MTTSTAPAHVIEAAKRNPYKRYLLPFVPMLLLLGVWVIAVFTLDQPIGVLPEPWRVVRVAFEETGEYLTNVWASVQRLFWGFVFAAVTGIIVGIAAGLSKRVSAFLGPLTTFMNAISGIAWIPLAIAWFGISTSPFSGMTIFIIWNAAFFLIFGNTMLGVRLVPQVLEDSLYTLGASRMQAIRQAIIPGAMPYIMSGLRSGLGFGWRAVIAAELVGATSGLGQWIFIAQEFSRADIIVAGALTIGAIGMAMDRWLLAPLERRTVERWGLVGANT